MTNFKEVTVDKWDKKDIDGMLAAIYEHSSATNIDRIYAVGSRVFGGFSDRSDLDILIYGNSHIKNVCFYHLGLRVTLAHFPTDMPTRKAYGKWDLPLFDLINKQMIKGNSQHLEEYREHRKGIKENLQKISIKKTKS